MSNQHRIVHGGEDSDHVEFVTDEDVPRNAGSEDEPSMMNT